MKRNIAVFVLGWLLGCAKPAPFFPPSPSMLLIEKRSVGEREVVSLEGGEDSDSVVAVEYRLRPGDDIRISVWQEPTLTGTRSVDANGMIDMPLIGLVRAVGLTELELVDVLRKALSEFIINPHVEVSVDKKLFYISGAVERPGSFPVRGPLTLYDAILMAGGRKAGADLTRVKVVRSGESGRQVMDVDVSGDGGLQFAIHAGDSITLSTSDVNAVKVFGEVRRQGMMVWQEGMTASDAIIQMGGFTDFAAQNKVEVKRGSGENAEVFRVKVKSILSGDSREQDVILKPGDIITVPSGFF